MIFYLCFSYFQFHKGAIETTTPGDGTQGNALFQFHKGAIETTLIAHSLRLANTFNSIKVRLKHQSLSYRQRFVDFQFHKGAIETVRL